jgi:hypothetical protein
VEQRFSGTAWHCNRRNLCSCFFERNLRDSAVLLFSVSCQGCDYLGLQVKAINCISTCFCPVLIGFNLLPTAIHKANYPMSSYSMVVAFCWILLWDTKLHTFYGHSHKYIHLTILHISWSQITQNCPSNLLTKSYATEKYSIPLFPQHPVNDQVYCWKLGHWIHSTELWISGPPMRGIIVWQQFSACTKTLSQPIIK